MSTTINARMGATEWLMLLTLSVLWGGSFFFMEIAVAELPVLSIVAVRVALAALTLWLVALATRARFPWRREIVLACLGMGLLNNVVPFTLIVWGQTQIASGLASILNATMPLFTVLVAHRFLADERMTPMKLAGVLVGLASVALMLGPALASGRESALLGQLAVLGAALSYGFAGTFGRRFRRLGATPLQTATGQLSVSTLVLLPLALAVDRPWQLAAPSAGTVAALVALAVLCTALAYLLFFRVLASAGATNISLVTLLVPLTAILLGALFLGERLAPWHFGGMAGIAVALSLVDGRLWRQRLAEACPDG